MRKAVFSAILFSLSLSPAFGDGWNCHTTDAMRVYLVENTATAEPDLSTLVISDREQGTLLVRYGREISHDERDGQLLYRTEACEKLNAETAVVSLDRQLGQGELILLTDDDRSVRELVCDRIP
jgi:hypothetical protein